MKSFVCLFLMLASICLADNSEEVTLQTVNDTESIKNTVQLYFTGTYYGKVDDLIKAFHKDAIITGSINGTIYTWSLDDFIDRVTTKPTAADKNEKFDKEILLVDVTSQTAMVKTRVSVGEHVFTDYIILLKVYNQWVIRFKSFTT